MKRVLILGASGFVGNSIYKDFSKRYKTYGTYYSQSEKYSFDSKMIQLDIHKDNDVDKVLEISKPHIIIWCLRGDFKRQLKIHKKFVKYIKSKEDGKYIFLSSVNVFDGADKSPHYENDILNSKSDYGRLKVECEEVLFRELKGRYVILRLPFIWGNSSPRLKSILNQVQNENKVNVWSNLYINNTSDTQIINCINIIERYALKKYYNSK